MEVGIQMSYTDMIKIIEETISSYLPALNSDAVTELAEGIVLQLLVGDI